MGIKIDLQECLRDSPKFRSILENEEQSIDQLEQNLEKILKICYVMIESGKTYVGQQSLFANSLWELSGHFREDSDVLSALNKLIHNLQEMNKFHTTLLDQASRTILKNISSFVKNDIKSVKEHRHHFEKISNNYDEVLIRNSHVPRSKLQEVEEVENILVATKSLFGHETVNYVNSIYELQSKKRHEILSTLLSYMHACTTYYHQGEDLCNDLQPFFKRLGNEIASMRDETHKLKKEIEKSHELISQEGKILGVKYDTGSSKLEGYLFKRTSNAFKSWERKWFYLYANKLVYKKRSGDDQETEMEDDLRICAVKPVTEGERRFCFEIVSPTKSHILQADSAEMYHLWIDTLQKQIGAAINTNNNSSKLYNSSKNLLKVRMLDQILKIPGNNICADCKSPNPHWASINLGIILCIECSGVHRSLGVHYSKVRSLTLDDWEHETIKVVAELGNSVVNKIYEAGVPTDVQRATEHCTGIVREEWIKSKYVEKKFIKQLSQLKAEKKESSECKWGVQNLRRSSNPRHKKLDKRNDKCDSIKNDNLLNKQNLLLIGNEFTLDLPNHFHFVSDQQNTDDDDNSDVEEEDMNNLNSNLLLYNAAGAHNLPVMGQALALGADKNWANPDKTHRYPLHAAVLSGSVMPCAYLLLNGVKCSR